MSTSVLDDRLNAFTSGTAEENLRESTAGAPQKLFCELACEFGHVTLQHRRTTAIQLSFEDLDDVRVVVTGVVHAIPGKKINDAASIVSLEAGA
jgi:hypothetical protein